MSNYILIPAYKPEQLMLPFIQQLFAQTDKIIVVDDGSGCEFASLFDSVKAMGITVLTHDINKGKGRALKTGIEYISKTFPDCTGIITADCDGQHTVNDILRVSDALLAHPDNLIIGGRALKGDIPLRSKLGNDSMRLAYRIVSRNKVHDTQTGLRGIPSCLFANLITLPGERYEYEMNMLLYLRRWNVAPYEIEIETIYINDNSGSHYNPLKDSIRIGRVIFAFAFKSLLRLIKFCISGVLSYVVEYVIFSLLLLLPFIPVAIKVSLCNVIARVASSLFNYAFNRNIVFNGNNRRHTLIKYFALVLAVMCISTGLLYLLTNGAALLFNTTPALCSLWLKPLIDTCLFFANYYIQKNYIFGCKNNK